MRLSGICAGVVCGLLLSAGAEDKAYSLDEANPERITSGWRTTQMNKSIGANKLSVGGLTFEKGIGTHANSAFKIMLDGTASILKGRVGVDDETGNRGSVEFKIEGDGKLLWKSGVLRGGAKAMEYSVNLENIRLLKLEAGDGGDGNDSDHADWLDPVILYSGEKPALIDPMDHSDRILTPCPDPKPRINGPKTFGIRPGRPFLFTVPVSGERPMCFSASPLPKGLTIDPATGIISGKIIDLTPKTYTLTIKADNSKGKTKRAFTIVVGERICLTPPLGWNSWNCWGPKVDANKVSASAKAMYESGLAQYGWTYINIDDCWQGERGGPFNAIQPNKNFGDMKQLAEDVHKMGLKLGIYSTPWCTSYAGFIGGSSNEASGKHAGGCGMGTYMFDANDAKQWAEWGIDYVKYDWKPNDVLTTKRLAQGLLACGRDIILSLSNCAPIENAAHYQLLANCYRTTGDIRDEWATNAEKGSALGIRDIWKYHDEWQLYCSPGHFPDADMMVVGKVFGWNGAPHLTKLTPDEQFTHVSLWTLWASPMLLGCPVESMDRFTKSLLTNVEVLDVHQDSLTVMGKTVSKDEEGRIVILKPLEDGALAAGLFNCGDTKVEVKAEWKALGISGKQSVRDLWRQKELGVFDNVYTTEVPSHGVVLVRIQSMLPPKRISTRQMPDSTLLGNDDIGIVMAETTGTNAGGASK